MEILSRWTGAVVFECEKTTMKETVIEAVKNNSDLRGANLHNSDLSNSNLRGANLSNSDLNNSDLRGATLSNSDLNNSDLRGANLYGADICDTNFDKTKISYRGKTVEVNFKEVK